MTVSNQIRNTIAWINSSFINRPRLLTSGKYVGGEEPFLCFDLDGDSGLEVDGEVVFENCDLRDQALDQRLVKLRDGGGLLPDEILKVSDQPHLFIPDNAVDLSLLSHVP